MYGLSALPSYLPFPDEYKEYLGEAYTERLGYIVSDSVNEKVFMEVHHHQVGMIGNEVSVHDNTDGGCVLLPEAEEQKALPSSSSSPSHEFSFVVSLDSLSSSSSLGKSPLIQGSSRLNLAPLAIDLSPADDIFFRGHLLPLHLLSHLPVSPRTSTTSVENLSLPVNVLSPYQSTLKPNTLNNEKSEIKALSNREKTDATQKINAFDADYRQKIKPKHSTIFNLGKWRKGIGIEEGKNEAEAEAAERRKKKLSSDLAQVLKKYLRIVKPFLPFQKKERCSQSRRQVHSFSTNLNSSRNRGQKSRGRSSQFSAPASIRTSPANSGHLLVRTGILSSSSSSSSATSDSTMEELQGAIQAAIAHCKNSIAFENKLEG